LILLYFFADFCLTYIGTEGSLLSETSLRKISSEYILIELGDGLSRLRFRQLAGRLIHLIGQDPSFEVISASPKLFTNAVTLFNSRPDKEWGLTDCTSIVIMQERGLDTVLSADRHFLQAGLRALLLESLQ